MFETLRCIRYLASTFISIVNIYIYIYYIYRLLNKALRGGYEKQESGILSQRAESLFTKIR